MDAAVAAGIGAVIRGIFDVWATHAGKPEGWKPTQQDIDDVLALNEKTPDEFYAEAAKRLGVPWPPAPESPS